MYDANFSLTIKYMVQCFRIVISDADLSFTYIEVGHKSCSFFQRILIRITFFYIVKKKKEYAYISIFPEMKNLKKGYLTDEEIDFFGEYLDYSKLSKDEQVMEYWQSLFDEEGNE